MSSNRASRDGRALAWLLWAGQAVVAAVTSSLVWFRAISIPHCGHECDFELLRQTSIVFASTALALVACCAIGLIAARSRRWQWAIPLAGIVLTVIAAGIAHHLSDIALRFA